MKKIVLFFVICISTIAQAQEILLQQNLNILTEQYDQIILKTENNVKAFVDNFNIKLSSGSKIYTSGKTKHSL